MARAATATSLGNLATELDAVAADGARRYGAPGPVYFGGYLAGATLAYAGAAQALAGSVTGLTAEAFAHSRIVVA